MSDLVSNAQWAVEKLECEDWEVGPFDGHCLRLTCKRCLLDRVVQALATSQAELAAMRERAEAAEAELADIKYAAWELFHGEESPMFIVHAGETPSCIDCGVACTEDVSDIVHEDGCSAGALYALAAAPPAPAADQEPYWFCRCGRRLINPSDADPWCEGCNMSASTCDCVAADTNGRLGLCVCGHINSVHSRHPGDCTAVVVSASGMRNWCMCKGFSAADSRADAAPAEGA